MGNNRALALFLTRANAHDATSLQRSGEGPWVGIAIGKTRLQGQLDIVIVNWNAGDLLGRCLRSIADSRDKDRLVRGVFLVDNASSDGSLSTIDENDLPMTLLRQEENIGYGRAADRGARAGEAPYLLFLNPDMVLGPDSLCHSLARLEELESSGVGILGIALTDRDGGITRSCARFPHPLQQVAESLGLPRLWPRRFKPTIMDDWDHAESREVDHVMGAFWLMPRKTYEELGGFDPDYFVYWEDLDFSKRAAEARVKSYYARDIAARHEGGGTTEALGDGRRLALALQARRVYARKHFSPAGRFAAMAALWLLEPAARLFWGVAKGSPSRIKGVLVGYGLLLSGRDPTGKAPAKRARP